MRVRPGEPHQRVAAGDGDAVRQPHDAGIDHRREIVRSGRRRSERSEQEAARSGRDPEVARVLAVEQLQPCRRQHGMARW